MTNIAGGDGDYIFNNSFLGDDADVNGYHHKVCEQWVRVLNPNCTVQDDSQPPLGCEHTISPTQVSAKKRTATESFYVSQFRKPSKVPLKAKQPKPKRVSNVQQVTVICETPVQSKRKTQAVAEDSFDLMVKSKAKSLLRSPASSVHCSPIAATQSCILPPTEVERSHQFNVFDSSSATMLANRQFNFDSSAKRHCSVHVRSAVSVSMTRNRMESASKNTSAYILPAHKPNPQQRRKAAASSAPDPSVSALLPVGRESQPLSSRSTDESALANNFHNCPNMKLVHINQSVNEKNVDLSSRSTVVTNNFYSCPNMQFVYVNHNSNDKITDFLN